MLYYILDVNLTHHDLDVAWFDLSSIKQALYNVKSTLCNLTISGNFFIGGIASNDPWDRPWLRIRGSLGSFKDYPNLRIISAQLSYLMGWKKVNAGTLAQVLLPHLERLNFTEDMGTEWHKAEWESDSMFGILSTYLLSVIETGKSNSQLRRITLNYSNADWAEEMVELGRLAGVEVDCVNLYHSPRAWIEYSHDRPVVNGKRTRRAGRDKPQYL